MTQPVLEIKIERQQNVEEGAIWIGLREKADSACLIQVKCFLQRVSLGHLTFSSNFVRYTNVNRTCRWTSVRPNNYLNNQQQVLK